MPAYGLEMVADSKTNPSFATSLSSTHADGYGLPPPWIPTTSLLHGPYVCVYGYPYPHPYASMNTGSATTSCAPQVPRDAANSLAPPWWLLPPYDPSDPYQFLPNQVVPVPQTISPPYSPYAYAYASTPNESATTSAPQIMSPPYSPYTNVYASTPDESATTCAPQTPHGYGLTPPTTCASEYGLIPTTSFASLDIAACGLFPQEEAKSCHVPNVIPPHLEPLHKIPSETWKAQGLGMDFGCKLLIKSIDYLSNLVMEGLQTGAMKGQNVELLTTVIESLFHCLQSRSNASSILPDDSLLRLEKNYKGRFDHCLTSQKNEENWIHCLKVQKVAVQLALDTNVSENIALAEAQIGLALLLEAISQAQSTEQVDLRNLNGIDIHVSTCKEQQRPSRSEEESKSSGATLLLDKIFSKKTDRRPIVDIAQSGEPNSIFDVVQKEPKSFFDVAQSAAQKEAKSIFDVAQRQSAAQKEAKSIFDVAQSEVPNSIFDGWLSAAQQEPESMFEAAESGAQSFGVVQSGSRTFDLCRKDNNASQAPTCHLECTLNVLPNWHDILEESLNEQPSGPCTNPPQQSEDVKKGVDCKMEDPLHQIGVTSLDDWEYVR